MEKAVAIAVLVTLASVGFSSGRVYTVGDKAGWTVAGVNYSAWASNKRFVVGDVLRFTYNPAFHNVLGVVSSDYRACDATTPVRSFHSGNDSIHLSFPGYHYFICGSPGHCGLGQKLRIHARDI